MRELIGELGDQYTLLRVCYRKGVHKYYSCTCHIRPHTQKKDDDLLCSSQLVKSHISCRVASGSSMGHKVAIKFVISDHEANGNVCWRKGRGCALAWLWHFLGRCRMPILFRDLNRSRMHLIFSMKPPLNEERCDFGPFSVAVIHARWSLSSFYCTTK